MNIKTLAPRLSQTLALTALFSLPFAAQAGTINQIGTFTDWPTLWTAIPGLNDPAGEIGTYSDPNPIAERLDFVGDATDPGGYFAISDDYLFFRMRTNVGTVIGTFETGATRTYKDGMLILIDVVGSVINASKELESGETVNQQRRPDYGFAWDANLIPNRHGLEMQIGNGTSNSGEWGLTSMSDIDGDDGIKGATDINGPTDAQRTTDGYVRTIDGQTTANFGTTSFIDFAVSWSYLNTYTDLDPSQSWNITFASIQTGNDHAQISADVAAGADVTMAPNSPDYGWTPFDPSPAQAPIPATLPLLGLGLLGLGWARRRTA